MEVVKAKCDDCFWKALPDELKIEPKPVGSYVYPDGKWTAENREKNKYVPNPIHEKWIQDRESIRASLPEVWCVMSLDDYLTTVCLDCLGLQLKESDVKMQGM